MSDNQPKWHFEYRQIVQVFIYLVDYYYFLLRAALSPPIVAVSPIS